MSAVGVTQPGNGKIISSHGQSLFLKRTQIQCPTPIWLFQPPIPAVPEHPMPSSSFWRPCLCMVCRHTHADKTHTETSFLKKKEKRFPCLSLLRTGITGLFCHTQLIMLFFKDHGKRPKWKYKVPRSQNESGVVSTWNASTGETEAGESQSGSQCGLQGKILVFKNTKERKGKERRNGEGRGGQRKKYNV